MTVELQVIVCVQPGAEGDAGLGTCDLRAVEYAVRLAHTASPRGLVTAVAVGTDSAVPTLQECSARGVDATVLARLDAPSSDSLFSARCLAAVLAESPFDLVLAGARSDGGMHGAVARELARLLGTPFVGNVLDLDVERSPDGACARAVQRLERGDRWTWRSALPLVCSVEPEICAPRYLAVRRRRRAASQDPQIVDLTARGGELAAELAAIGSLSVETRMPPRIRPKKPMVATAAMSPADRMKMLRGGGGKPAAAPGADDATPRRIAGEPATAATEIVGLLERKGLLKRS